MSRRSGLFGNALAGVLVAVVFSSLFAVGCANPKKLDAETLSEVRPAAIAPEPINTYKELGPASPHWVLFWVMTNAFEITRVVLLDADTAEMKATITTGIFPSIQSSSDGRELYVPDTFNHGPERARRDVLSIYDTADYSLIDKLELPKNQRALMAPGTKARSTMIDDGRLLVLFNFSPRTSVTVIDPGARKILNEIETPGCFLVYPTGRLGVSMLCGDGRLLTLRLNGEGQLVERTHSEAFFDPDDDPIMESAAELDGTWYFPSYAGDIYPVDLSGERPVFHPSWSLSEDSVEPVEPAGFFSALFSDEAGEAEGPWLPGGYQLAASHESRGELYFLMHPTAWSQEQGDHVFPGTEVWVYDVETKQRIKRLALRTMAGGFHITSDEQPLLIAASFPPEVLASTGPVGPLLFSIDIYDAVTGEFLRDFRANGAAVYFVAPPGSEERR
jgi:methylamine dehydrogenase heavy chain